MRDPWGRWAVVAIHGCWRWLQRHAVLTVNQPASHRFAHFGEGALIAFPPGALFGEEAISIGHHTLVGERVSLSAGAVPGQDLGGAVVLRIGHSCSIGRGTHIVAHESIVIGNDVFLAPFTYVTDQNHGYTDPVVPIGRQRPRNRPVVIGDGCWVGYGSVLLPGTRLGAQVTVAAGSVVRSEFPDHCLVAGVPARMIRRFDPRDGWQRVPATSTEVGGGQ